MQNKMFIQISVLKGVIFILLLTAGTTVTSLEATIKPTQYVSLLPSTFNEGSYSVVHNTDNCVSSIRMIDNRNVNIITCPTGGLLFDQVAQPDSRSSFTNQDVQLFSTWNEETIPLKNTFITLQFPNKTVITRVEVHCLVLQDLRIHEPKKFELFSSATESIYPNSEIKDVDDSVFTVTNTGRTIIQRANGDDDDDDDGTTTTSSAYEYRKYNIKIPADRQIPLKFLRISLDFEGDNWIFISEVEAYHVQNLDNGTSSTVTPNTRTSMTATPRLFSTPVFVFPVSNPFELHVTMLPSNLTINCTIEWDGDPSQLNITWYYNKTQITNSSRYTVGSTGYLLIRWFTSQDAGMYVCIVQHLSRWEDSRQYSITTSKDAMIFASVSKMTTAMSITATPTTSGGTLITASQSPTVPGQNNESTNNSSILIAIVGAAAASTCLLLCILICIIVCLRKRRAKSSCSDMTITPIALHVYESTEGHKCSLENIYEKVNTYNYSTIKREKSLPPVPPPLPKKFNLTDIKLPKPNYYDEVKPNYFSIISKDKEETEVELDIYDDIVSFSISQLTQEYLCEDIYYEAFDYSHPDDLACDHDSNVLTMCAPIYNEPTPLKRNEAPKTVECNNVNVLKKIGEGEFGDVYLAETVGIEFIEPKALVAIKTLKGDYSPTMKQQFEKEIKFMARLKNANVIRLLGICNKGTPFIMMEFMSNGDLHMFLRKHYFPEVGKDTAEAVIPIDSAILQYVALQIANGMRYLASLGFIHRDIAARNCLVGEAYIVKIADFGMTQDLYNEAYFVMRGKAIVPIRWMAPESFFGRFSTKTDVWSYGVTLWEIFTLCREQPYHEMTDEEIINNVQKARKRILLNRPLYMPDKVYDVMVECWIYNPTQRPDFGSLYDKLLEHYTA